MIDNNLNQCLRLYHRDLLILCITIDEGRDDWWLAVKYIKTILHLIESSEN
jgi:hypothetical protein